MIDHSECQARTITCHEFPQLLPWAGSEDKRCDAFLRPEASWRKMLVAQPPIRLVGLVRCPLALFDEPSRGQYRFAKLDMRRQSPQNGGLRMGELYDAVAGWVPVPRPGPEPIGDYQASTYSGTRARYQRTVENFRSQLVGLAPYEKDSERDILGNMQELFNV